MTNGAPTALSVERTIHIDASRERVFELLTDVAQMPRWIPVVTFEPRVGGRFEMVNGDWIAEGTVTAIDPPNSLAYTWDWRNQPLGALTHVSFDLVDDAGGTLLTLRHSGFPHPDQQASHTRGWDHYLARVTMLAEGRDPGPDPFLGGPA